MGFQALFKFVKCWRALDVVRETHILPVTVTWHLVADRHSSYRLIHVLLVLVVMLVVAQEYNHRGLGKKC